MFIHKLALTIATQKDAEIVKPCDHALKLDTVDQKNCYGNFGFADMIEKCVLEILFVAGHDTLPLFLRL